jgi:hypothetical protein
MDISLTARNSIKNHPVAVSVIAATAILIGGILTFFAFHQKNWKFGDISTISRPYDPALLDGAPCPKCLVSGPGLIITDTEYLVGEGIERPDGWAENISWSATREPGVQSSLQEIQSELSFDGASFYRQDYLNDNKPWDEAEWNRLIDEITSINGKPSGRFKKSYGLEGVFWGKAKFYDDNSGFDFGCSTSCLIAFRSHSSGNQPGWDVRVLLESKSMKRKFY